jgi:hypothetical protein
VGGDADDGAVEMGRQSGVRAVRLQLATDRQRGGDERSGTTVRWARSERALATRGYQRGCWRWLIGSFSFRCSALTSVGALGLLRSGFLPRS